MFTATIFVLTKYKKNMSKNLKYVKRELMVCFVYVVAMQHLSRALQANAKSTSVECAAQLDCPTKSS